MGRTRGETTPVKMDLHSHHVDPLLYREEGPLETKAQMVGHVQEDGGQAMDEESKGQNTVEGTTDYIKTDCQQQCQMLDFKY